MKQLESLILLEGVCGYIFIIKYADNSLQTKCYSRELLKQQLCPSYQYNAIFLKIQMQSAPRHEQSGSGELSIAKQQQTINLTEINSLTFISS